MGCGASVGATRQIGHMEQGAGSSLRIAFIGNSFTFYNNMPRVLKHILEQNLPGTVVETRCVLRGGSSLESLLTKGPDMERALQCIGGTGMAAGVHELLQEPAGWDIVVLQDYSQGPARPECRAQAVQALHQHYIPQLKAMAHRTGKDPLVLLYCSWGYVQPVKHSEEIGDFKVMTRKLAAGIHTYAACLEDGGLPVAVVDVGSAYEVVHDRDAELWKSMYVEDHYHPRPKTTFLIASTFAKEIARHPRCTPRFCGRLNLSPVWPLDCEPSTPAHADDPHAAFAETSRELIPKPSEAEIVALLRVVGGFEVQTSSSSECPGLEQP